MKYVTYGDLKIPTEFLILKDATGHIIKNAHYVIKEKYLDCGAVHIVLYDGQDVSAELRIISLHFFLDYHGYYKEYPLEKWKVLRAFI